MAPLRFIELHGDQIAYRDVGCGDILLLIHGMAGSSSTWNGIVSSLSQRYRVIAPDLPGHGESAKPRGDYSLGAFAAFLRDLLDTLGVTRATIVGHSLGGGVAMQFTYQHPSYCERLVLIGSGGLGAEVNWTLRLLAAPGAELLLPAIAPKPVVHAGERARGWLISAGFRSPAAEETWRAYASLSDGVAAGVPANLAFSCGSPRSGGQRLEPPVSECRATNPAHLGRQGQHHPRRARRGCPPRHSRQSTNSAEGYRPLPPP